MSTPANRAPPAMLAEVLRAPRVVVPAYIEQADEELLRFLEGPDDPDGDPVGGVDPVGGGDPVICGTVAHAARELLELWRRELEDEHNAQRAAQLRGAERWLLEEQLEQVRHDVDERHGAPVFWTPSRKVRVA